MKKRDLLVLAVATLASAFLLAGCAERTEAEGDLGISEYEFATGKPKPNIAFPPFEDHAAVCDFLNTQKSYSVHILGSEEEIYHYADGEKRMSDFYRRSETGSMVKAVSELRIFGEEGVSLWVATREGGWKWVKSDPEKTEKNDSLGFVWRVIEALSDYDAASRMYAADGLTVDGTTLDEATVFFDEALGRYVLVCATGDARTVVTVYDFAGTGVAVPDAVGEKN